MAGKSKSSKKEPWYAGGIQFECQGSGNCCQSRGEYGYVYLTEKDVKAAAKALGLKPHQFIEKHCQTDEDGYLCLKDSAGGSPDCIFLEGHRCGIYAGRPVQCRTWPFWPEVMGAKAWNKAVVGFCPGVGKGRRYTREEIDTIISEAEDAVPTRMPRI